MHPLDPNHQLDPILRNPKDMPEVDGEPGEFLVNASMEHLVTDANSTSELSHRYPSQKAAAAPPGNLSRSQNQGPLLSSPTEILTALLRFKWTVLIVTILVAGPLIGLIWTQVRLEYRARAEIRVRPIIPRLVFNTDENGRIPFYDSFVNTQVSIIRNLTVLQRVLDQNEVKATLWYREPQRSLMDRLLDRPVPPPVERLRASLSVSPRRSTEIIDAVFTDFSSKEAVTILDAVVSEYLQYTGLKTGEDTSEMFRKLNEEHTALENEIRGRELIISDLTKRLGTQDPDSLIAQKRNRIDELDARLSLLQLRINILRRRSQAALERRADSNSIPLAKQKPPEYFEDADWRGLDRSVRTIEHHLETTSYGTSHPETKKIKQELKFARDLRSERERQLDYQWENRSSTIRGLAPSLDPYLLPRDPNARMPYDYAFNHSSDFGEDLNLLEQQEQFLKDEMARQEGEFNQLFTDAQLLDKESRALSHTMDIFNVVRERLDQKRLERRSNVAGSIEVLTPAFTRTKPSNDRRLVFTAMVLFMSLGMGGGLGYLRALHNQDIHSVAEMAHVAQTPFLGCLPLTRSKKDPEYAESPLMTESVRALRTQLLVRLGELKCPKLLITSANAGTGKTSFTVLLAKSLASTGKRVLAVDADFYRTTLTQRYDLIDRPGFLDSLRNQSVDPHHFYPSRMENMFILPSGKRCENGPSVEEIANGTFKTWQTQMEKYRHYDIILFDSSPILPVADALILANRVDGTILVERESVSQRSSVQVAQARLQANGAHVLGVVFVGAFGSEHVNYGYSYRAYGHENGNSKVTAPAD